ncbi:conserved hypothetical protein [Neospora caninum Liverpool]|uniref:Uncharacterized protein n=1 Tax=Neospora caninum (strain Liverpool) TaxID=572307 RepID=F0V8W9_NEOCL|nr:conserved hypothetical protein [Neospora caninum Liverpool]CBZ50160.1 conserved hypothetical protein [Neospora caninum Liverpool]CEL64755.1 TPA: hypothetical protein BN1204_006360 [Neospora caninum Liverpool]|eukprot:XP_003880195.1 conserved hypothetical protein [Neospora caninum Liverpool]
MQDDEQFDVEEHAIDEEPVHGAEPDSEEQEDGVPVTDEEQVEDTEHVIDEQLEVEDEEMGDMQESAEHRQERSLRCLPVTNRPNHLDSSWTDRQAVQLRAA